MQPILHHLKEAEALAIKAEAAAAAAWIKAGVDHLPSAELAKIAPGRHRMLLHDIRAAIDRANIIAASTSPGRDSVEP
jgi:hypothetical protein